MRPASRTRLKLTGPPLTACSRLSPCKSEKSKDCPIWFRLPLVLVRSKLSWIFEVSFGSFETEAVHVPVSWLWASTSETATQPANTKPATTARLTTTRIHSFDMTNLQEDLLAFKIETPRTS